MIIEILFEDEALVAINKPASILSVPGNNLNLTSAHEYIEQQLNAPLHVVHRLDCATSGVMLFAKTKLSQRLMHHEFRRRRVSKKYSAVLSVLPPEVCGHISLPLTSDWPNRPKQKVCKIEGKASETLWRCFDPNNLQAFGEPALLTAPSVHVLLKPITGRTHQLRVHMAAIGCPILGDTFYAGPQAQAERLLLHATTIYFKHPLTGRSTGINCPVNFCNFL